MTLLDTHKMEIEHYRDHARCIETATNYTRDYLIHGSCCDSSAFASIRIGFVREAERVFIEAHKKEILALAAKMVRREIGEE